MKIAKFTNDLGRQSMAYEELKLLTVAPTETVSVIPNVLIVSVVCEN